MERVILNIPATTFDCQSGITNLLAAASGDGCCARDSLHPRDVEQIQDRFNQWAKNLGALESSESPLSLENRLRDAPLVTQSILSSLTDLHGSIQAAIDIALGKRQNKVIGPFTTGLDADLSEYDLSSSESDSSSLSSLDGRNALAPTSEMEELLSAIRTGLNSLFKASVFIRTSASEDTRLRTAKTDRKDLIKQLIDQGTGVGTELEQYNEALQAAAYRGYEEMIQPLLDRGADANSESGKYGNALCAAAYKGHDRIAQLLLDGGADVNAQGGKQGTAFQAAASRRHRKTMQRLLDNGANGKFQGVEYASITVIASNIDHSLLLPLSDSIGQLKQRMIRKNPSVAHTIVTGLTRSYLLMYDGKGLDKESRSCMQEGLRQGSSVFCLFEK